MRLSLRLGTRESQLALWQAEWVAGQLRELGHGCTLIPLKSEGDVLLDTPLPLIGGKGIFTKVLDDALLAGRIDLAVHSFKDLPTQLPEELKVAAVLPRDDPHDVLVARAGTAFLTDPAYPAVIATGSPRRRAQWLRRHPGHRVVALRGNVNTRLKKVYDGTWDGAIFAAAGLKRLGLQADIHQYLDWMLPAPAQGAIAVMTRTADHVLRDILYHLHDPATARCVGAERDFLATLQGGCSAPIGAWVEQVGELLSFKGVVLSLDGSEEVRVELTHPLTEAHTLGQMAAKVALENGAKGLIEPG